MSTQTDGSEVQSAAVSQGSLFVTMPSERQKGWAVYQDRVIFIVKDGMGKFRIRTGFICSTPHTHLDIDNVTKVVIWSDSALRDSDSADDAHEQSFQVKDPMLIRLEDVFLVRDGRMLKKWFEGILTPHEIVQIQRLLKLSDLGRANELIEIARRERPANLLRQFYSTWWQKFHRPIPLKPRPSRFWGQPA